MHNPIIKAGFGLYLIISVILGAPAFAQQGTVSATDIVLRGINRGEPSMNIIKELIPEYCQADMKIEDQNAMEGYITEVLNTAEAHGDTAAVVAKIRTRMQARHISSSSGKNSKCDTGLYAENSQSTYGSSSSSISSPSSSTSSSSHPSASHTSVHISSNSYTSRYSPNILRQDDKSGK